MRKNPFKGKNYDDSLFRNYKCDVDFVPLEKIIPFDVLAFLKKILVRHPSQRYSAKEALGDEIFFQEIYDEGSKVLSLRMKKLLRPKM